MKPLTEAEIKTKLARLYWDVKVDSEQLYSLFQGDVEIIGHIDIHDLYYRILTTFDWYTILRIVPVERLHELLSDAVLDRIRFKDLKDKLLYARGYLLQ